MDRYVPLPPFPQRISRLPELARDLWWSWNPGAREVFRDLDYPLWRFTRHNPVLLLHLVAPERLDHAAADATFLQLYDAAVGELDLVRGRQGTWWRRDAGGARPVAMVAQEFDLHQSLPVDASAGGVLVGDFCKEASDLGLPLVGVGLMYPRGFAHQRLSAEGWQQEAYEHLDWSDAPIEPATSADGVTCRVQIPLDGAVVHVAAWRVRLGGVAVYLLDTDLPENAPWDREISSRYFPDDADACLRQAVLLGSASVRVLAELGIEPATWHLMESAAAPVVLERTHQRVAAGTPLEQALREVGSTTVASTREQSPARRDGFSFVSIDRHLAGTWRSLHAERQRILALGAIETDRGVLFNPAALAARTARYFNVAATGGVPAGASAWRDVGKTGTGAWREAGTGTIAEGVHLSSWIAGDLIRLFDEILPRDWRARQDEPSVWAALDHVPDAQWWALRERLRGHLVDFIRERARRQWAREQASGNRLVAMGTLLDARTLTIGFARRFAEPSRPDLIFHDVERLARILTADRRPVQVLFAGKAHPGDETGKHRLQRVFRQALDPAFGGRVAFVEDYDLHVGRLLVQGCDVWLSTPRRGCPASVGGLRAAVNGAPHLSTPDGWWAGGWTGHNGWVIAGRAGEPRAADTADALSLYRLLEDEVVPAFYDRGRQLPPARWVALMKASLLAALPRFCARHSVKAFAGAAYAGAARPG